MAASSLIHGREGALYISTSSGDTAYGHEIGYTNSWTLSMSRDISEVTPLNNNSKEYVEGLIGGTVSAEGSFRVSDSYLDVLIGRFAEIRDSGDTGGSSEAAAITDGTFYLHLFQRLAVSAGGY